MSLVNYLASLNVPTQDWGIWVNPNDVNIFRLGYIKFDNGGVDDNWVFIGNLEDLSFANQDVDQALQEVVKSEEDISLTCFMNSGVPDGVIDLVIVAIQKVISEWALIEAELFMQYELPTCLAYGNC